MIGKDTYSKDELIACGKGELFGPGNAQLPIDKISRKQPISDVWTHNRMLEICHLANIAIRLDRELKWDPKKREIIGDKQANSFLSRENRKGFEIDM